MASGVSTNVTPAGSIGNDSSIGVDSVGAAGAVSTAETIRGDVVDSTA